MSSYPLASVFLLFLFLGCQSRPVKKEPAAPDPAKLAANRERVRQFRPLIKSGDLIFRNGIDEVSRAARSFNRKDTSFSHCGLVFIEHDSVFVYHALGGVYNPSQKLMRQTLEGFCNPAENSAIGIYRYPLNPAQLDKLENAVTGYYRSGLKFDLYFNYQSDDRMYCAEFVFKSLNRAVDNALASYVRLDTIPFGITTDDLFLHPDSRLVKREKFIY